MIAQPTTKEISDNLIAQLEASIGQTIPFLPKLFQRVLAAAFGGVFVLLYKYGGFIFLQIFVATASTKETEINGRMVTPIVEWGRLIGVGDPVPATQAEMIVDVTVTNQTGNLDGAQGIGQNNGFTYFQIGSIPLDAATKQINFRAVGDQAGGDGSGAEGNLEPGDIISFANPLPNVASDTVVVSQVTTAADGEDLDTTYRQRVIDRFQKLPQGGAYADYELWAEEVAGIINAYPYTSASPGQVDVYCEATEASSGSPDGIPTNAQLQAVLDSIELNQAGLATRRPANALANALAIERLAFDVTVTGLSGIDDPIPVQNSIIAAVEEYFLGREPFIVGVTVLPRVDTISRTSVSGIVEQIVSRAGGIFSGVTIKLGIDNIEVFTLGEGQKSKAGSVVFL